MALLKKIWVFAESIFIMWNIFTADGMYDNVNLLYFRYKD